MRRSACLLGLVVTALAVPGPAAAATPVATLDMAAELLRQPPRQPWSIALHTGATIRSTDGLPPPPLRRMTFRLPHARFNAERFPVCRSQAVRDALAEGCPRRSRLGTGVGLIDARPLLEAPLHADLQLFNGPERGGRRLLFIVGAGREVQAGLLIVASLHRTTGRYGWRLDAAIPPIQPLPTLPEVSVSGFELRIAATSRGRRRVPLVQAPRTCPRGGLPFAGTFSFADGSVVEDRATISCVLRARPTPAPGTAPRAAAG